MRLPLLLQYLLFLLFRFGEASPELVDPPHESGPQLIRRANISTITQQTTTTGATLTTTITVLTFLIPSPSAAAIPITSQSQLVTSYVPQLTACPITTYAFPFAKRQALYVSGPTYSYSNISRPMTASAPPSCSILYSPTVTPICHTTLTPLGSIPSVITACDQSIAFQTDYGFYYPSNGPVELVPTTYVAPWDSVITGAPLGTVIASFCPSGGACTTYAETWYPEIFQATATSMSTVDINTVVTGVSHPSILLYSPFKPSFTKLNEKQPIELLIPPSQTLTIPSATITTVSVSTTFPVETTFASTIIIQDTYLASPTGTMVREGVQEGNGKGGLTTTVHLTSTSTRFVTLEAVSTAS